MPIVRIDVQTGKSTVYKRALLHGVRKAITEALEVPDDRVIQRVVETPAENIDATEVKSDRLTIVQISMLSRESVLKESLYKAISREVGADPGISAHDLVVIVNEPTAECFFLNGQMQCSAGSANKSDKEAT